MVGSRKHAYMVRSAKLIDSINLEQKDKEYNLVEVLINLENSNVLNCSDL